MGHAVYSVSDPRERVLKSFVKQLVVQKKREEDSLLYEQIERMHRCSLPPLFAIARIVCWSAHRMYELVSMDKIIRPAYKSLMVERAYIPWNERG